jgi:enolase-phosphatase E1
LTGTSRKLIRREKFPYALKALPDVLATKWDDEQFKKYRDGFPESARSSPGQFEEHVKDLTARDMKIAYLKDLQGRVHCKAEQA